MIAFASHGAASLLHHHGLLAWRIALLLAIGGRRLRKCQYFNTHKLINLHIRPVGDILDSGEDNLPLAEDTKTVGEEGIPHVLHAQEEPHTVGTVGRHILAVARPHNHHPEGVANRETRKNKKQGEKKHTYVGALDIGRSYAKMRNKTRAHENHLRYPPAKTKIRKRGKKKTKKLYVADNFVADSRRRKSRRVGVDMP
jgi:hypothetical protein